MLKEKEQIRKLIADKKKEYTKDLFDEWSTNIYNKIIALQVFKNANVILIYHHLPDEVRTDNLLTGFSQEKQFLLPVVKNDILIIRPYKGKESLKPGVFGILEPTGEDFQKSEEIDLIIVPGVAFDKKKNRLGRGKGYYDKLLIQTKALKIGVCFDFQLLEAVPTEKLDIPMDIIITPTQYL